MKIVGYAAASGMIAATVLFLVLFNGYVFFENYENHTGAPLEATAIVFVLIAAASGLASRKSSGFARYLWLAAAAFAVLAAANIAALDGLHVMMSYETWVHGQPERPGWSIMRR
jgi:hypothetical protein